MHLEVERIIRDIKSLKIQGARNVAKSSLRALSVAAKNSKAKSIKQFYRELLLVAEKLSLSRPTEPMMRNMIEDVCRFVFLQIRTKKVDSVLELKKKMLLHEESMLDSMELDTKKLAKYGADLIPNGALVLTHCHSSTTTRVLKTANDLGKEFSVVCFETRPRFQGRITASELLKAGIDVTLTVDGAMELFAKKADIVIVGADSITSRGDLINKIGTSALAHIAQLNDVSFYSAAELFKYSPTTLFGTREKIEERDPKEVWVNSPRGLKIRNPAFEATAARYINGYITEAGVVPPQSLFSLASQKLGIKLIYGQDEYEEM